MGVIKYFKNDFRKNPWSICFDAFIGMTIAFFTGARFAVDYSINGLLVGGLAVVLLTFFLIIVGVKALTEK